MHHLFFFLTIGAALSFIFIAGSLRDFHIANIVFLIVLSSLSFILVLFQTRLSSLFSSALFYKKAASKQNKSWEIGFAEHLKKSRKHSKQWWNIPNIFHKASSKSLLLLTLLFSLCAFAPLPFYLVDDMIRHIHDGYYLLQGVDVYSIAPEKLPLVIGQKPNHPQLPTIYLPFTQAQAMLGATFSVTYGFRIIYISICIFLVWGIYKLALVQDLAFYLYIFFSPAFLIFLCSHHADVQGFLLASFIGLWINRSYCQQESFTTKPRNSYKRRDTKPKNYSLTFRSVTKLFCNDWSIANYLQSKGYDFTSFIIFFMGFLAALIPSLKPEGAWWLLCFSIAVFTKSFLSKKSNNRSPETCLRQAWHNRQISANTKKNQSLTFKTLTKLDWKQSLLWIAGVMACLFLQLSFVYYFLWLGTDAFANFMQTIHLFMDWFLAYNPILLLRTGLYEANMWRPEIFALYRQQIFTLGVLCFFLLPGLYLRKIKYMSSASYKSNANNVDCTDNTNSLNASQLGQILVQVLLLSGLLTMLFNKGTWYPWYFLWLLPALGGGGILAMQSRFSYSLAYFLVATFPLFYLPFVQLRSHGLWQFQSFYVAYGISILVWIYLIRPKV